MDTNKKEFSFDELVEIVRILRSPGGCPWDAEQTHKSIRNDFIEETYEVADAIDRADSADLCEELGDVLLQVVMHSQMAVEDNEFSLSDVISGISRKMILRHPHVFGDVKVENTGEVLKNWDAIKKVEKNQESAADTLYSVPMSYPSLMRTTKVIKRARKAGVQEVSKSEISKKISETAQKLSNTEESLEISENIADLLFNLCRLAYECKIDSEEILNKKTDSFIKEFAEREKKNEGVSDLLG